MRRLHIGGTVAAENWEVFNSIEASCVDHLGNANDLSRFPDNTFDAIYASHVVEHFDYINELALTLREWLRTLVPGGSVYISVPDLDVLAGLLLDKDSLDIDGRYAVMRMIFGGHVDQYDYHVVGLNEEFLVEYLRSAGYVNMRRVESFGFFQDTSEMLFNGVPISLNIISEKLGAG